CQAEDGIRDRNVTGVQTCALPILNLIAHPTGRLLGRREGYHVHVEKLIERAKETNTALEINANPNRLDLSSNWAKKAQEIGAIRSEERRVGKERRTRRWTAWKK